MYIAAVLTAASQRRLFDRLPAPIPPDWLCLGHHMTVEFRNARQAIEESAYYPDGVSFGMPVTLAITHWKKDGRGFAVLVTPSPAPDLLRMNQTPHVTVAVAPGVKPFYSNELLAAGDLSELSGETLILDAVLAQVWDSGLVPPLADMASESYTEKNMDFANLQVGGRFFFATRELEGQQPYTKAEEMRRPYTPEAYSNAMRSDGTVFYVTPTTKVIPTTLISKR